MHSYLRAVGFSHIRDMDELDQLLSHVRKEPTHQHDFPHYYPSSSVMSEVLKDFAPGVGICVRGEYDENEKFHLEHYFPYLIPEQISVTDDVIINRRMDSDAYTGMCDDYHLGISLIFYLQNVVDHHFARLHQVNLAAPRPVALAALSTNGRILLPIAKSEKEIKQQALRREQHNKLLDAAKRGNEEAIDTLTMEDIDTYAMVNRRARNEDLYSIVESTFIPYGSESDNYSIVGSIQNFRTAKNELTGEEVVIMNLLCNDLFFSVCINRDDLWGEPAIGRRFKGNIWMQGNVKY